MANLPDMTKHRGFPGGMPGTGIQFTIRRANPKGVTPLKAIPRRGRPGMAEHRVDAPASSFYALEASRHLGLGDEGGVRVGLAPYNDDEDVDRLLAALEQVLR